MRLPTPAGPALLLVVILLSSGGVLAPPAGAVLGTAAPTPAAAHSASPTPAATPAQFEPFRNTSLAPGLLARPGVAPPPISALSPVPLPPIPATTPTVMTFLTNSTSCCVSSNFTAPSGSWALILLNYTGEAVNGVYDSSFRAYIDQAQVFFGTTPEYGIWYDTVDVTEYTSLLQGTFNFTFLLGAAVTNGYFLTSVSLTFYPVPTGAAAPTEPNAVIPIWHRVFVSTTSLDVASTVTVPTNATNATLELWAYGFGPDEFWYATSSPYRAVAVSVDNQSLVDYVPFPYINTGGNDLFAWRPIPAVYTLSDRPYELNATGWLGLLEGTHYLTATVTGVTPGSNWLVGASLLVYTRPGAPTARESLVQVSAPTPHSVSSGRGFAEFGNTTSAANSTLGSGPTATDVVEFTNTSYASAAVTPSSWMNLTAAEAIQQTIVARSGGNSTRSTHNWTFGLSMNLGSSFVPNAGQGTGYPIYGNVTEYLLNLRQEWNETESTGAGTSSSTLAIDNRVTGGSDVFVGTEELTGPNAALLTGITFVQSATQIELREREASAGVAWSFDHIISGSVYNAPPPNNAEAVLVNAVTDPVAAGLSSSVPSVEVGGTVDLSVRAVGGSGGYQFLFEGLPGGCTSSSGPGLACHPSVSGSFDLWAVVTDSSGVVAVTGFVPLVVVPGLAAEVPFTGGLADEGSTQALTATVTGGLPPYTCDWQVPGLPVQAGACTASFDATMPATSGPLSGNVTVSDLSGVHVVVPFQLSVVPGPSIAYAEAPPLSASAGTALALGVSVSGGVAPFTIVWIENGSPVQNSSNANLTVAVPSTGTLTFVVEVTDADGQLAVVGPTSVAVSPATTGCVLCNLTVSTPSTNWGLVGAVGLVALVAGIGIGVLVDRRRRPPPP